MQFQAYYTPEDLREALQWQPPGSTGSRREMIGSLPHALKDWLGRQIIGLLLFGLELLTKVLLAGDLLARKPANREFC